jgi:hypothetical protein
MEVDISFKNELYARRYFEKIQLRVGSIGNEYFSSNAGEKGGDGERTDPSLNNIRIYGNVVSFTFP